MIWFQGVQIKMLDKTASNSEYPMLLGSLDLPRIYAFISFNWHFWSKIVVCTFPIQIYKCIELCMCVWEYIYYIYIYIHISMCFCLLFLWIPPWLKFYLPEIKQIKLLFGWLEYTIYSRNPIDLWKLPCFSVCHTFKICSTSVV